MSGMDGSKEAEKIERQIRTLVEENPLPDNTAQWTIFFSELSVFLYSLSKQCTPYRNNEYVPVRIACTCEGTIDPNCPKHGSILCFLCGKEVPPKDQREVFEKTTSQGDPVTILVCEQCHRERTE